MRAQSWLRGRHVLGLGAGGGNWHRSRLLGRLVIIGMVVLATAGVLAFAGAGRAQAASVQPDWSQLSPAHSPPARSSASLAFDPASGQLLLFGGNDASFNALGDTWSWTGSDWTQLTPAHSPPARYAASLAFDPASGQLLLFGGCCDSSNSAFGDTWSWTGSDWTQLSPAHSPAARDEASLAFDPASGQLLLFGGANFSSIFGDTWSWTGSDWTQLSPAHSPVARFAASLAFDSASGQLLLFGGYNSGSRSIFGDTWSWTGSDWTQLSPAHSPVARARASLAFDPASGQLLLFGGENGNNVGDTWAYGIPATGDDWSQQQPAHSPPARYGASLAFDPASGQLLLFGGFDFSNIFGDTWSWNGSDWTQLSPAHSPPARTDASLAFDPASGQLLLFGGTNGFLQGDTWSWNGSDWTQLSPAHSPPARRGASLAFDPASGQLLLFGGFTGSAGSEFDDTWSWNGTDWTQLSPTASPPARTYASLAFDPASGQLLLFGGLSSGNGSYFGDTWSWTGSDWTQLSPAHSPAARAYASLAFDPASGQLLLFGGVTGSGSFPGDTWSWTGSDWTQLTPAHSPSARSDASLAFDPASGQLLLFGGQDSVGSGALGDTWAYLPLSTASPTLTTTPSPSTVTLGTSAVTLTDSAVLAGGNSPTGSITFTLVGPNGATLDTETATVSGNGTYATPTGYTLPTSGTVTGTYQWNASYSGDGGNNPVTDNNNPAEQVTVSAASPTVTTTASPSSATVGATLKDSAVLAGGYAPSGSITFTLTGPSNSTIVDTETVTVSGNGTYTTPTGYVVSSIGTYQWHASYNGDGNNATAADQGGTAEQVTVTPASTTTSLAVTAPTQPSGLPAGIAVAVAGQAMTLTATVSPTPDGGTVSFTSDGTTTLCSAVVLSSGTATCTTTYAAAGKHSITASYSGDSNYLGSSASLTLYVDTDISQYLQSNGTYNLSNVNLSGGYFVGDALSGATLADGNFSGATFSYANLSGANLTDGNFKGATFTGANLTNANLTNANFKGATLSGVTWSNTICPDGTNSNNDGNTCVGHL